MLYICVYIELMHMLKSFTGKDSTAGLRAQAQWAYGGP